MKGFDEGVVNDVGVTDVYFS